MTEDDVQFGFGPSTGCGGLAAIGPDLSLYGDRAGLYLRDMNCSGVSPRLASSIASLSLALLGAAALAVPAQAAFPGQPGPIVFTKATTNEGTGSSGGIFFHGPRKSEGFHPLTKEADDQTPSYSANGRKIVFAGDREPPPASPLEPTPSHIYLMNADDSDVSQLTSGENYDSNPSFSPNGQQVVFDRQVGTSRVPHIFIVNVDGTGLRALTEGSSRDSEPVFTPNGKRILFASNRDTETKSDHSNIFAMAPSGANIKLLIGGPRDESEPDPSPNGRAIVFTSTRDHGPNVFVARSNGTHVRELTHARKTCFDNCYISPSWAPDGQHIALLATSRYVSDLEVMRSDGRRMMTFIEAGFEEEGYGTGIGPPSWGPKPK